MTINTQQIDSGEQGLARKQLSRLFRFLEWRRNGITIIFVVLVVILAVIIPNFLSVQNIQSMLRGSSVVGILAMGMTLVMVGGGFDLSVARVAALSAVLVGLLNQSGPIIAVGVALLVGTGIGIANGVLVTKARVNPFIVTLGMMSVAGSLALVAAGGQTQRNFAPWLLNIAGGTVGWFPTVGIYFLGAALVCHFLLRNTRFGRYIYAAGGNAEATRLTGIPVDRVILSTYMLMGFLSAAAGIVLASYLRSATSALLLGAELDAIAAVIIGGTRLGGGTGSVPRTVLGVFILAMLSNALVLLGINPFWQDALKGSVIIAAVAFDAIAQRVRR